jgi:hypothetical protein
MRIKTLSGLVAALAIMTSTAAYAQHYEGYRGDYRAWGGEPKSFGAGHMPRAFYDQEQPGYPQSPPGGGF